MAIDLSSAEAKSLRFEALHRIGVALSKEQDRDRLVESILLEAKRMCHADGGTLYLVDKGNKELDFAMIHTDSLGIAQGGTTGNAIGLPSIALFNEHGRPNASNVATRAYHDRAPVHIPDAYSATGFDLSGTHAFDRRNSYRSVSLLAIPLHNSQGRVLAVLQLINARDEETGEVVPFHPELQRTVIALAAQAGIALDNQELLEDQRKLLDAFIRLLAEAIDAKSPYTGDHCERVPELAVMFVRNLCEATTGPFADFRLTDAEWRELRVAAWLHDCGKVTTPVHVMDKATKLETIHDRIELVLARYEILERDAKLRYHERLTDGIQREKAQDLLNEELSSLRSEREFLKRANVGGEFLDQADQERIREIATRRIRQGEEDVPLLSGEMVENLTISRGTLTREERLIINGHMVQTIRMLERLPFPEDLKRVPEYAGGHHEKMDGSGYPKGLYAGDMSVPARALAIADVFEALTASDRPYKKGKPLSVSLRIMAEMKQHNHLDPELFDEFVTSKVYLQYAERFLKPAQIDAVDEKSLLEVRPQPFAMPPRAKRDERWQGFLPEYQKLVEEG
jgi:HD-GYP domain-containing protein (c-di-GMP phosphodiesterase class II)